MSVLPASEIKKSNLQVRLQNPQEFIKIRVFYCILIVFFLHSILFLYQLLIIFFFLFSENNVIQSSKFLDKGEFPASNLSLLTLQHSHSFLPIMLFLPLYPLPHTLTGNHMLRYPFCSTLPFLSAPLLVNSLCS